MSIKQVELMWDIIEIIEDFSNKGIWNENCMICNAKHQKLSCCYYKCPNCTLNHIFSPPYDSGCRCWTDCHCEDGWTRLKCYHCNEEWTQYYN